MKNNKMINCRACGKEIAKGAKVCPNCGKDQRNFFSKHKIVSFLLILFVIGGIGSAFGGNSTETIDSNSQSKVQEENKEDNVPKEYKSALTKATIYANDMYMSKDGLYEQLVSEYGEKFSEEAAKYAVENVEANWKENALQKAKTYQDDMAMSPDAIYEQLISSYGEKFTEEEAQYAIDNLEK